MGHPVHRYCIFVDGQGASVVIVVCFSFFLLLLLLLILLLHTPLAHHHPSSLETIKEKQCVLLRY